VVAMSASDGEAVATTLKRTSTACRLAMLGLAVP
jgi:hypothetical protein